MSTSRSRFIKLNAEGNPLRSASKSDWLTVLDRDTDLIWTRDSLPCRRVNWKKAQAEASKLDLGSFKGWRLPTRVELLALVDDTRHSPAINTDFFRCESFWYWTSTPAAYAPAVYAWIVDFDGGNANYYGQDGDGFVRAVRPRQ